MPFSLSARKKDVGVRDERGHDGGEVIRSHGTRAKMYISRAAAVELPIGDER